MGCFCAVRTIWGSSFTGGYLLQKQENGSLAQPQAKKGAGRVSAVASSAFRGAGFCLFAETAF